MQKKLHEYDKISDLCLQGVVGLKFKESTNTYTPTRYFADQFHFDFDADFAPVYPLFKTHKLKPGEVYSKIDQIPIRLVTAANRIPTSKIMNMLEMVLSEPMQKYCGSEYTKDSPDYLKCLTTEKVYSEECLSILCLDVEKLYPSASRDLTLLAVEECLTEAEWNPNVIQPFLELVRICMKRIYIKFNGNAYSTFSKSRIRSITFPWSKN